MFCPKCGSILVPKKEGEKRILVCSCGYRSDNTDIAKLKEKVESKKKGIEVVEKHNKIDILPTIDVECPKCGHRKAKFWTVQTRAGDEPETKFLKCKKCGHTWRDYT